MPGKQKVLIIDDNEDILFMLKVMLEFKNYEACARTGINDLEETITHFQPDLILMDMLLSGADGREVCRALKANKLFARYPVVMISAQADAREECLEAGASLFLEKPFDMDEFYKVVEVALNA
jgi:DNA-binding response OmpR family regulator